MPALFVFLLKVNAALLLFCAGYYLVLRHLTFYTLNRIYLVTAILFASVYPQINLSGFAEQHQQIARPVQAVIYKWQAPAEKIINPLSHPGYWQWVEIAFWMGAVLLSVRLLIQLYSLLKLYRNSTPANINNHDVRIMNGDSGPFSFWKSIYVNPANHSPSDLKSILLHEQVHINEWHTLDILLAELSTIFYWFNPGIWLIKKAIRENIEFITDRKILNKGIDSKQYQYSLVNVSFSTSSNTIVNHFNISTIKKRIIMMNAKRSSKVTLSRYAFLVPAVVALLLVFSISKAALVTKTNNAFKALKIAIIPKLEIVKRNIVAPLPVAVKKLPVKKSDTVRNGSVFISTPGKDSLTYVINGVKGTEADFKAIDPSNILSILITTGEHASKIMDKTDLKKNVLFLTTKDSEAGKKFQEKIDRLGYTNDKANSGDASVNGITGSANNVNFTTNTSDSGKVTISASKIVFSNNVPKLKLKRVKYDTLKFTGTTTNVSTGGGNAVTFYTEPDSVTGYGYSSGGAKNFANTLVFKAAPSKFKVVTGVQKFTYTTPGTNGFYSNSETSINHLSAKLIMIDGKEAKEKDLKKLSASDIESMTVKSGEEVTKKYGDKAKNGVVFISTKKS